MNGQSSPMEDRYPAHVELRLSSGKTVKSTLTEAEAASLLESLRAIFLEERDGRADLNALPTHRVTGTTGPDFGKAI